VAYADHLFRLQTEAETVGQQLDMAVVLSRSGRYGAEKAQPVNPAGQHLHHTK